MAKEVKEKELLVSIITVVFNGENHLEETILSVLNQTYRNIEYIIIDGGSSDRTVEIIRQYESKIAYWISEPDSGIYDAMNKGIAAASGELIGMINCGDTYTLNAVAEVAGIWQKIIAENTYLIITGAMYRIDTEKNLKFRIAKDRRLLEARIDRGMPLNHPATFVSKAVYEKFGTFDPQYRICGDYDFIFRVYHSSLVKFEFTESDLAYMRLGGVSEQFNSLWVRCREHFHLRNSKMSVLKNLYISGSWYAIAATKFLLRKVLSNSLMSVYYKVRHGK